jgi:hypothetical protein
MADLDTPRLPHLSFIVGTTPILSIDLNEQRAAPHAVGIGETQPVGFEVSPRERGEEYRIRIGNVDQTTAADTITSTTAVASGRAFGSTIVWEDTAYFESARGRTSVFLDSRNAETQSLWRERTVVQVVVVPTKLGELRYQRMLEDLCSLAAGLVFDILSKSTMRLDFTLGAGSVFAGSSQLELRTLELLWNDIADALREIGREPVTALKNSSEVRQYWGSERLSHRSTRYLAAAGLDVRRASLGRPYRMVAQVTVETTDTIEHRRVLALLDFLRERALACAASAEAQIRSIERDKPFREIAVGSAASLYESIDAPRIANLNRAADDARSLASDATSVRQLPFLSGVRAESGPLRSPVFDTVAGYRRVRIAVQRYFQSAGVVLSTGEDEPLKSTARMYEQWVLLQVLAALRASGLECDHVERLVRPSGARRFTLDIERGTAARFRGRDGRIVSVRYEPWIFPRQTAKYRCDSLYRGREGSTPWSPDILLTVEVDDASRDAANSVQYAIVIDAKYTRKLNDDHWTRAQRYLEIKSTRTDRQVVHQVWLAHPEPTVQISFVDADIRWGVGGPSLPYGDRALGVLPLAPQPRVSPEGTRSTELTDRAREFIRGLLSYLDFEEASRLSNE